MSDFQLIRGFEEVWRAQTRIGRSASKTIPSSRDGAESDPRARLARIAQHAPEVMVKVVGDTHHVGQLVGHLNYISRKGELELEGRDEAIFVGRDAIREVAHDWAAASAINSRRRVDSPLSRSIILSMPAGTDVPALQDAARAFARGQLSDPFDYVLALHTDTPRPHVHLAVRAIGDWAERLNPTPADLETWRQSFAQALRDRDVEAEATPRRARGVTRKPERSRLYWLMQQYAAGRGAMPRVLQDAYREAAQAAFQIDLTRRPWEASITARQASIRATYLAQAKLLQRSSGAEDRALGEEVELFVRQMPAPDSRRLALARELRSANSRTRCRGSDELDRSKDRS